MTPRQLALVLETSEEVSTPFYVYDTDLIRTTCRSFRNLPWPDTNIHFATMANPHPRFLSIIREEGLCLFVNSMAHLDAAFAAGCGPGEVVYAASAMDESTMEQAHRSGIRVILDSLGQVDAWRQRYPASPFGIRCNLGTMVHARRTRGGYFIGPESRLGLQPNEIRRLAGAPDIEGLHLYAGTDICDLDYFERCYRTLTAFAHFFPGLTYLDFGGGFGLEDSGGQPFDLGSYGRMLVHVMEGVCSAAGRHLRMVIEPGRLIGGRAGLFVCRAVDIKPVGAQQGIGVNASSAQFPRPLLYPDSAFHPVWILRSGRVVSGAEVPSCVFGCSTYSRDFLSWNCRVPGVEPGDLVVFGNAGAYCAALYTRFLGFPPAAEVFS